ncbi:hypothetical protein C8R48DRAFT_39883 [Suillus tomentosus]|nr:hypothetical protein C8R48DRAFT_39883 [Suillus tomentosus]
MLFSATFDNAIKKIARIYLDPNYKFISTLHADEINTHEHVPQSYLITPLEDILPTLVSLLKQAGLQAKQCCFVQRHVERPLSRVSCNKCLLGHNLCFPQSTRSKAVCHRLRVHAPHRSSAMPQRVRFWLPAM